MNRKLLDQYIATLEGGTTPEVVSALSDFLKPMPNADELIGDMIEKKMPLTGALGYLRTQNPNIAPILAAIRASKAAQSETQTSPAPAAGGVPQTALERAQALLRQQNAQAMAQAQDQGAKPAADGKPKVVFPGLPSSSKPGIPAKPGNGNTSKKNMPSKSVMIGAAIGAVLLLLLLVIGGISMMGSSNTDGVYVPGSDPSMTATPAPTDASGDPQYWFSVSSEKLDSAEPFIWKPASISDFFKHLPWRWLLWVLFFIPMMVLLAQDRFAAAERTDLSAVLLGIGFLFGGILLAEPLAGIIHWISVTIERPTDVAPWIVMLLGIVVNLTSQWSASSSGRKDYSAFAIAGLFITGAVVTWWFPNDILAIVIGVGLMFLGIGVQSYEMGRSKQGGRAIAIALVMLVLFGMGMGLWLIVTWAITGAPQPDSPIAQKALGILLWGIVASRLWVGGLLGMVFAYAGGDMVSSLFMPPTAPGSNIGRSGDQEVRSNKVDNNARYDAMVFGIMLLYPISFVLWEVVKLFGAM